MNDENIVDICKHIKTTILIADTRYTIGSMAAKRGLNFDGNPVDPQYLVFRELYECAVRLRERYLPLDIERAVQRFDDIRQENRGTMFLLGSDRSQEIETLTYCLRAVDQHRDIQTAFQKWIN